MLRRTLFVIYFSKVTFMIHTIHLHLKYSVCKQHKNTYVYVCLKIHPITRLYLASNKVKCKQARKWQL